jgi:hypothetical protein
MIIFGDKTSFKDAEIGDKFCIIEYGRWSGVPVSVINYTVKKTSKRDIRRESADGREIIVKTVNTYKNPKAYVCGGVESIAAVNSIHFENRVISARRLIEGRDVASKFDDLLLTAIEEWNKRVNKLDDQS